jgi:hypothetical protein
MFFPQENLNFGPILPSAKINWSSLPIPTVVDWLPDRYFSRKNGGNRVPGVALINEPGWDGMSLGMTRLCIGEAGHLENHYAPCLKLIS